MAMTDPETLSKFRHHVSVAGRRRVRHFEFGLQPFLYIAFIRTPLQMSYAFVANRSCAVS